MPFENYELPKLNSATDITKALDSINKSDASTSSASIFIGLNKSQFATLVEQKMQSTTAGESIFFNNINVVGASNMFDQLDTNKDGVLQKEEVESGSGVDGNASSFSSGELRKLLCSVLLKALEALKINSETIEDTVLSVLPSGNDYYSNKVGGRSSSVAPTTNQQAKTIKEADLPELEAEKQEIISVADQKIQKLNKDIDYAVQNSEKVSADLKDQHKNLTADKNQNITAIQEKETAIENCTSKIASLGDDITSLQAEFDNIATDTDDDALNEKNKTRKSEISSQIESKKSEKTALETEKAKLETEKTELEQKKNEIETQLAALQEKIMAADPDLQRKISDAKAEIQQTESTKATDVAAIDQKIQAKRTEASQLAQKIGEVKGKMQSNATGEGLAELGMSYFGMGIDTDAEGNQYFSGGNSRAWCADFVSSIAREYCERTGRNLPDGFGSSSVSKLRSQATDAGFYQKNDGSYQPKPGDVIVWKDSNLDISHVAYVAAINEDGTIQTIEGNWGDSVASNKVAKSGKKFSEANIDGYIQLPDWIENSN